MYLRNFKLLPDEVQKYFGLDNPIGSQSLSWCNDNGASFNEIADIIENWLKEKEEQTKQYWRTRHASRC